MNNFTQTIQTTDNQATIVRAAEVLRQLALNEKAKAMCSSNPLLRILADRVAAPYIAGRTSFDAAEAVAEILARGHAASAEYMGENCRDEALAHHETEVFLELIQTLNTRRLACSISFDLSHIGAAISSDLGFYNARRIAWACRVSGREMMISMEGSDRTDIIFDIYRRLHEDQSADMSHVGITLQARLHRSGEDLDMLLNYPGRIRLVKGAYFEPKDVAYERSSRELVDVYLRYAEKLIASGHKCSIATHDIVLQQALCTFIDERGLSNMPFEFESLIGLGTKQIDALQKRGTPTREYAVYGEEYFLYVLNRIAEDPMRLFQAVIDTIHGID